jgi:hypothetical protein
MSFLNRFKFFDPILDLSCFSHTKTSFKSYYLLIVIYILFSKANKIEEQHEIIKTLKIYHEDSKDLDDNLPNKFYIRFSNFGKNFTYKFAQIKKDSAHPIGSNHVYTINSNREPRRHIFQEEEVNSPKMKNKRVI